jgi:glycosyltransferase involved in cell wall biosynthesis
MRSGLRLFYNPGWMGGVNYVLNIARMLRGLPESERPEIVFLTAAPQAVEIAETHRHLADQTSPFSAARCLDLDFVYPATQLPEAAFGAPWAGWIPDWQCQHYPELFPDDERARRFLQFREIARRPVSCVFSSQQAVEDTRALLGENDTTEWDVFHFPAVFDDVTWERSSSDFSGTRERFGIPERYLIICNQFWRHKNHLIVAEALAAAPEMDVHVVMTGEVDDARWPDYAARVKELLSHANVAGRVTVTGRISREDQLDLLCGAAGYIQPSLFEGWSTFVEEARALGLPGLLSDIPVHREQSPAGAMFFDPGDVASLAGALSAFLKDSPPRLPAETARAQHRRHTDAAARKFMSIAQRARARYREDTHGAVTAYANAMPELFDEIGHNDRFTRADFDRWLANARLALRDHPEDLARIAIKVMASGSAFALEAETLLVKATLGKCAPEIRDRFAAFDPVPEAASGTPAMTDMQKRLAKPGQKALMSVRHSAFRVRDALGRMLKPGSKRG